MIKAGDEGWASKAQEMYDDIVEKGLDPDVDYVTYIRLDDDRVKVLEKGDLLACIEKAFEVADGNGDPMLASLEDFTAIAEVIH